MKKTMVLVTLLVALTTMGFECINDPIIVSIAMDPISRCYNINAGPDINYTGSATIDPSTLIDDSYEDKIVDARVYDITVQVTGAFTGSVTNGVVRINGTPLLTYSGTWADFSTPQSLLGTSPHVIPQAAGIAILINALKQKPLPLITLSSTGTLTGAGVPPVPSGLSVCASIYAQVDGNVKGE